jgi:hypothetical protein
MPLVMTPVLPAKRNALQFMTLELQASRLFLQFEIIAHFLKTRPSIFDEKL